MTGDRRLAGTFADPEGSTAASVESATRRDLKASIDYRNTRKGLRDTVWAVD
jgi:hypothetical protein